MKIKGEAMDKARLRILIAEDDELNRMLMGEILEKSGFDYVAAENGQEAVEFFAQKHHDVVILDRQMPIMDGMEAAERIRELAQDRKVTPLLIALSGDAPGLHRGEEGLFDHELRKPFTQAQLVNILKDISLSHTNPAEVLERLDHHTEFLRILLDQFNKSSMDLLDQLKKQTKEPQRSVIAAIVHQLKGEVSIFSAYRAILLLEALEQSMLKEGPVESEKRIEEIIHEIRRVQSDLSRYTLA